MSVPIKAVLFRGDKPYKEIVVENPPPEFYNLLHEPPFHTIIRYQPDMEPSATAIAAVVERFKRFAHVCPICNKLGYSSLNHFEVPDSFLPRSGYGL